MLTRRRLGSCRRYETVPGVGRALTRFGSSPMDKLIPEFLDRTSPDPTLQGMTVRESITAPSSPGWVEAAAITGIVAAATGGAR